MPLKLISVNIEGDNHYERLFPFFLKEQPDVICVQEIFAVDMPLFEEKLGMKGIHVPLLNILSENNVRQALKGEHGISIFSKYAVGEFQIDYYAKKEGELPLYKGGTNEMNRAVLSVKIEKEDVRYAIATTHFTWTPAGSVTDLQRKDLVSLFKVLDKIGECVVCGDFNAPRGKEIFDALATRFTDNIPKDVTTTIDQNLHRKSGIQFVVDGLFTSQNYKASDARVVDGVSDHCAVVAMISKEER